MTKILSLIVFLAAFSAFAEESGTIGQSKISHHYQWVTFKCTPDAPDGPDSTPQSPPLDVDDPGTPGCNQWEINVVANADLAGSARSYELPLLDINYGIGDNLQLKYEVPYVNQQSPGTNASAVGDAKAGIKYLFYQNEETEEQLAVYPQLSILSPDRTALEKGISSSGKVLTLPVLYTRKLGKNKFGDINFTGNLGYNLSSKSDETSYFSAAAGFGIPVHPRFTVMAEISTEQHVGTVDFENRQEMVKVNLGFIGTITKNILFFASAGHSLSTSDDTTHAYVLSGIRLLSSHTQD
jgi:hypothetical protein